MTQWDTFFFTNFTASKPNLICVFISGSILNNLKSFVFFVGAALLQRFISSPGHTE